MSASKHAVRERFRNSVFARARYRCQGPGCTVVSTPLRAEADLDAHHITDRHDMPNGGYVADNGIALCKRAGGCHEKAEASMQGEDEPHHSGFTPDDLYKRIGSSREQAMRASERFAS